MEKPKAEDEYPKAVSTDLKLKSESLYFLPRKLYYPSALSNNSSDYI